MTLIIRFDREVSDCCNLCCILDIPLGVEQAASRRQLLNKVPVLWLISFRVSRCVDSGFIFGAELEDEHSVSHRDLESVAKLS